MVFKGLNEPITSAVCAQRSSSPRANFFLFVSAPIIPFSYVYGFSFTTHPEHDSLGNVVVVFCTCSGS